MNVVIFELEGQRDAALRVARRPDRDAARPGGARVLELVRRGLNAEIAT